MKAILACIPCIIRQTIEVADMLKLPQKKKRYLVSEIMDLLKDIDISGMTPPEVTNIAHKRIKELTGTQDLYAKVKKHYNNLALRLYPKLKRLVARASDPFNMAIRLAIAGNVIDYGANSQFDIGSTLEEVVDKEFAVDDSPRFKKVLAKAKEILYIGDNAGEIVFDKLLVEELGKKAKVTFAVKSAPVLNDAMMEDAIDVSMTSMANVIESGSENAGTELKGTSKEFKKVYKKADFVIAKGQGNLETLEDKKKEIFYLLKFKCSYLAKEYGVRYGDIVLASNRSRKRR